MELFSLLGFAVATTLSPGPNTALVFSSSLNRGYRHTLPLSAGICVGFPLMVLAMGLGAQQLFLSFPWIQQMLKLVFALLLLVIVWSILRDHPKDVEVNSRVSGFLKGMSFQLINPKAWLSSLAVFSLFSPVGSGVLDALLISGIYLVVTIFSLGFWVLAGHYLHTVQLSLRWQKVLRFILATVILLALASSFGVS
jgi:threonine/homoserine/homoserine lactone efflux protein